MTRRDFVLLAKALSESKPHQPEYEPEYQVWARVVVQISTVLADESNTFDPEMFIKACKAG